MMKRTHFIFLEQKRATSSKQKLNTYRLYYLSSLRGLFLSCQYWLW